MKVLTINEGDYYYNVFSLDEETNRLIVYPSLTDFVNRYLAVSHLESYQIRTIFADDIYDKQNLDAICYLRNVSPKANELSAIQAFHMLYNSNDSYSGIQLD